MADYLDWGQKIKWTNLVIIKAEILFISTTFWIG